MITNPSYPKPVPQIPISYMAGVAAYGQLNLEELPTCGSRSVECFEKLEQVGEGTYGQVYKAREESTGEIVALKKIRMDNEKEGFPITAIREIKILKKLQHENVIKLKEIVTSPGSEMDDHGRKSGGSRHKSSIYMVFEYMDHDLTGLADCSGGKFTVPQIKCYMRQLLTGLHYCHVNQVLHRDIKSANLLINNEGDLKIADFGLSRSYSKDQKGNITNNVVTLWYRPPELLLGATIYGPSVDMWSVGCIFAKLLNGKPILTGKDEHDQLNRIFDLCGYPTEITWPGVSKLPRYNKFKPSREMKKRIREVLGRWRFDGNALELLEKMLTLDPSQRISAKDALDAEYFWADPLPCDPKSLPKYKSSHEFQTKKKREQRRQNEDVAKRQKIQHQQQHTRLPPMQQSGQARAHSQHWAGHDHSMDKTGQYGKPRGAPGGPNRHPPGSNSHSSGPRGSSSVYGTGPQNYSQNNVQYGASSGARGRGRNVPGNSNQPYSWREQ